MGSNAAPPFPRGRSNLFDFLRCALAVLVIYSHSYALLAGSDATEPLYRWSHGQITWGGLAVDGFFLISGYLITQSWMRSKRPGDFFLNRVLRIFPAFTVIVALGVLVVAPLSSERAPEINVGAWLLGTLNLQGYSPAGTFPNNPFPGAVNGSLWSISYECWCYVGVALLGMGALLKRRVLVSAIFLLTIATSIVFVCLHLEPGGKILGVIFGEPSVWARLLPYYLAGTTFYIWQDRIPLSWPLATLSAALLVAGALLAPWVVALTYPLALTYLLLFLASRPIPKLVDWARYGDLSYGLYLYAFPMQQLLVRWLRPTEPLALFTLATPLVSVCAFVSWHAIEKPFLELRPSRRLKPAAVALPEASSRISPIHGADASLAVLPCDASTSPGSQQIRVSGR